MIDPVAIQRNAFYKKYVDAGGYPVLASGAVSGYALNEAAFLIERMLAKRPDMKRAMAEGDSRLLILALDGL